MKKRLLALLLSFILVFSLCPVTTFAATGSGKVNDHITWSLNASGVLSITGTGTMPAWTQASDIPWNDLDSSIKTVTISDGITSVGAYAFAGCSNLTGVSLPTTLTSISNNAFESCSLLNGVALPAALRYIGVAAFAYCTSLTSVTLPEGITSISASSFRGCSELTTVNFPDSLQYIDILAFLNCTKLNNVQLPDGVTKLNDSAFENCIALTSIDLPAELTTLGACAFQHCLKLDNVVIPDKVTYIGIGAFIDCESLTSLTLPASLIAVDSPLLSGCNKLTNIYYNGTKAQWTEKGFDALTKDLVQTVTIRYGDTIIKSGSLNSSITWSLTGNGTLVLSGSGATPNYGTTFSDRPEWFASYGSAIKSIVVEENITALGSYLFYKLENVTSVTLPASVTSLGSGVFMDCASLPEVTLPANLTAIPMQAFSGCTALKTVNMGSKVQLIDELAFSQSGITAITLPNSLTTIKANAFYKCNALTAVTLPAGVTTLGGGVFQNCSKLESATLPATLTTISGSVTTFSGCSKLSDLYYTGTETDWNSKNLSASVLSEDQRSSVTLHFAPELLAFGDLTDTMSWTLTQDGLLTITGTGDMPDFTVSAPWYEHRNSITAIVVEDGVTSISALAFYSCLNATSITLPEGLTKIGYSAFSSCAALTSIELPASLTVIDGNAFSVCLSLSEITIPAGVTIIPDNAFSGCNALKTVTLPGTLTTIVDYAFSGCSALESIKIPASVTTIRGGAFNRVPSSALDLTNAPAFTLSGSLLLHNGSKILSCMDAPTTVTIPEGVTAIEAHAFCQADKLTAITIPGTVTSIGDFAFSNCSALTEVTLQDGTTFIGSGAFEACSALTTVTLPKTVTSFGYSEYRTLFKHCAALEDIYYTGTETKWEENGMDAMFEASTLESAAFHFSDGIVASGEITNYNIWWKLDEDGLLTIGGTGKMPYFSSSASVPWLEYSESIRSVVVEQGITEIGSYAFYECTALTSISLPEGITELGFYSFRGCTALTSIEIPSTVTTIPVCAFYGCTGLTAVSLPDNLTKISGCAFEGCSALTSINIPATVTTLGDSVFARCTSLESITLPAGITAVPFTGFIGCSSLSSVTLLGDVTSIGYRAFKDCTSLQTIALPDTVNSLSNGAFYGCTALESIVIPDGVTEIPSETFYQCSSLTSITLPDSVESFGLWSFKYCASLKELTLPANLTTIGNGILYDCPLLTDLYFNNTESVWNERGLVSLVSGLSHTVNVHFLAEEAPVFAAMPAKIVYAKGEALSLEGLSVTAGDTDVTAQVTATGYDAETIGKQTVTLTIGETTETYEVYVFGLTGATLTLEGKIDINFYASFPGAGDHYTAGALFFTESPTAAQIEEAFAGGKMLTGKLQESGLIRFMYSNIAAKEMNDLVYIVPVAKLSDGTALFGKVSSTSPAQYVAAAFDTYQDEKLRTMLVDMLNYGAAAQKHFGYRTNALANANLTAAQKAYGTQTTPELSPATALYTDVLSSAAISLTAASLTLENELSINVYASILGDAPVKAELLIFDGYTAGGTYDETTAISSADMTRKGSAYVGSIANIPAKYMRKDYYARIHTVSAGGEHAYSNILRYDVATYAYTVLNDSYAADVKELADCMMRYGDSAAAYFGVEEETPAAEHTVTFNIGEGTFAEGTQSTMTVADGEQIGEMPSVLPPKGHRFLGWFDGDTLILTDTVITGDMTLTAKYERNALIVTFDAGDGTFPEGLQNPAYVKVGSTMTLPEPAAPAGMTFAGWFNGETQYTDTTPFTADVTLTAKYITASLNVDNELFTIVDGKLTAYKGTVSEVTVPAGVTTIGSAAFQNNGLISSVTLPDSVTTIESAAFKNCVELTSINLPNSVTVIEEETFMGCSKLASIIFPANLTSIGKRSFQSCGRLTSVTIPNSVTEIVKEAFRYCTNLSDVSWAEEGITSIGSGAFESTALDGNLIFPKTLKTIGSRAFFDTDLIVVEFHDNLEQILDFAFANCSELRGVNFYTNSKKLYNIGKYAFYGTAVSEVMFPASIIYIGEKAFATTGSVNGFSVLCAATTPPTVFADSFAYCSNGQVVACRVSVTVPEGFENTYKTADVWQDFHSIIGLDFSLIG